MMRVAEVAAAPISKTALRPRAAWTIAWCALAAVCLQIRASQGVPLLLTLRSPFFIASLLPVFFFLFAAGITRRDLALLSGVATLFLLVQRRWLGLFGVEALSVEQSALVGIGLGSLFALGTKAITASPGSGAGRWLQAALIVPAFVLTTDLFLALTVQLHPLVRDGAVLALDGTFGDQPSFVVGRWLARHGRLGEITVGVYLALPVALGGVGVVQMVRLRTPGSDALDAFVMAGVAGFALYNLFPVVGPLPLFAGRFPHQLPAASFPLAALIDGTAIRAPRNCLPSLHTAWALLLYWHARPLGPRLRLFGGLWLALTLLGTLGLGQHYLIDLVLAVPFAAAIDALVGWRYGGGALTRARRWAVVRHALIMLAFWYAALFWGARALAALGPVVPLLAAATLLTTWIRHERWANSRWQDPPLGARSTKGGSSWQ